MESVDAVAFGDGGPAEAGIQIFELPRLRVALAIASAPGMTFGISKDLTGAALTLRGETATFLGLYNLTRSLHELF